MSEAYQSLTHSRWNCKYVPNSTLKFFVLDVLFR